MRILTCTLTLAAALAAAAPAVAQGTGASSSTQKKPAATAAKPKAAPAPKPAMGIRAFFGIDVESMAATQSFKAVTGSSTLFGYGGGVTVTNLVGNLFVRGSFATAAASGERVVMFDTTPVSAGVGIDIGLRTIEVGGGWRLPLRKRPQVTPYVGGGLLLIKYTETSQYSSSADNVDESFRGYAVEGGVDFAFGRRLVASVEAQYRMVPDALGVSGVSKTYGEADLGGLAVRALVGFNLTPDKSQPKAPARPASTPRKK